MERKLKQLVETAIKRQATDIHFIVKNDSVEVQLRRNGQIEMLEGEYPIQLFRYLQYRANLDVSDVIKPQTGQFNLELDNQNLSLRFAVLSTLNLVNGVLRILNADFYLTVSDLCMNQNTVFLLKKMLHQRFGLILLSGPTGSGKTTTMYTLLNSMPHRKIFTIEDPIEIYSPNIVQLQINEKMNLDYKEAIRQLLRHDPDVIVFGEIRDEQAASMAIRCALTGHLVIGTIHAYNCLAAVERMIDLNVSKKQLFDVLQFVSNQRLFSDRKGGKTGIYEIMDRKQLLQYNEAKPIEGFVSLYELIKAAISKNEVDPEASSINETGY